MTKQTLTPEILEDRLIDFAVMVIKLAGLLPNSRIGNHLGGQIERSCTSPALNYGEAQSAESRKDFIHKVKIIVKELRETKVGLKIIKKLQLISDIKSIEKVINENNELISIFMKSYETAKRNLHLDNQK